MSDEYASKMKAAVEAFVAMPPVARESGVMRVLANDSVEIHTPRLFEVLEQHAAMLAMLERLEYVNKLQPYIHEYEDECPVCEYSRDIGHRDDCELAALLKKVRAG